MDTKFLDLLCDPKTHKPLTYDRVVLKTEDGKNYPVQNGIPVLMDQTNIVGQNLKYQRMYDKIAKGYDWANWIYGLFHKGGVTQRRREFLKDLTITQNTKVLETSIGTGLNIPLLSKAAEYHGLDISMQMLKTCQKKIKGYNLHLVQANAEELPYKDNSFDVVFHVGGINFFNNIPKAIIEMIRVAKPGAQILICDETQEHVNTVYKKIPLVRRFFKDAKQVVVPIKFIPPSMKYVKIRHNKGMYILTFSKP